MRILRAVRGFDPDACVLLAETDYVIVTYDTSILEGAPSRLLRVAEATGGAAMARLDKTGRAKLMRLTAKISHPQSDTLDGCLSSADTRFTQCRSDPAIGDKSICYNNRSKETQQGYLIYGGKPPKQEIQN